MPIEQKTIVDQVECLPGGALQVRMQKQWLLDGRVVESRFHRTAVDPGGDLDAQMQEVNRHLTTTSAEKYAPVEDWSMVRAAADAALEAREPDVALVVNFQKRIIGRRSAAIGEETETYNVRTRAAFMQKQSRGQALHDLVFTKELRDADDAAVAEEARKKAEAEEAAKVEQEMRATEARERFQAMVNAGVEVALRDRGAAG